LAIQRYQDIDRGVVPWLFDLGLSMRLHATTLRFWLRFMAPIVFRARLVQLGWDGIDQIPFIGDSTRYQLRQMLLRGLLG
jgi:hypothetical protein